MSYNGAGGAHDQADRGQLTGGDSRLERAGESFVGVRLRDFCLSCGNPFSFFC